MIEENGGNFIFVDLGKSEKISINYNFKYQKVISLKKLQ